MGTMNRQLSRFLYEGFTTNQKRIYGPGTLYEISYKIGTTKKDNERINDVTQLLDKIHETPADVMKKKTGAYTFAFECHAFNFPKKDDSDGIPEVLKGFSTYMFVPDTKKRFIKGNVESAFAEPNELEDEEDPLKLFSAVYSDDYGTSMNENLTVIELTLERAHESRTVLIGEVEYASTAEARHAAATLDEWMDDLDLTAYLGTM